MAKPQGDLGSCCLIWYLVTKCGQCGPLQSQMSTSPGHPGRKFIPTSSWLGMGPSFGNCLWEDIHLHGGSCHRNHHGQGRGKQDVTLNHYLVERLQIRHWKHMLHSPNQRAVIVKWYHSWPRGILLWWAEMPLLTGFVDAFLQPVVHCLSQLELPLQCVVQDPDSSSLYKTHKTNEENKITNTKLFPNTLNM